MVIFLAESRFWEATQRLEISPHPGGGKTDFQYLCGKPEDKKVHFLSL